MRHIDDLENSETTTRDQKRSVSSHQSSSGHHSQPHTRSVFIFYSILRIMHHFKTSYIIIIYVLIKIDFKYLTGYPQIKVNNSLGELAGKTLNIQENDDSTETIRDCYFHVDSSLRQTKPFKSSGVYFS